MEISSADATLLASDGGMEAARDEGAAACVWPLAVLLGASLAGALALGTWLCAGGAPWPLADWVAGHALWGAVAGGAVSALLRLCRRMDPVLQRPTQRRAAAARLTLLWILLGVLCLVARTGRLHLPLPVAAGLLLGAGVWCLLALPWLRGLAGSAALPAGDPVRAAVLVALLTLPLADGVGRGAPGERPSLPSAWRVMLR